MIYPIYICMYQTMNIFARYTLILSVEVLLNCIKNIVVSWFNPP